MAPHVIDKGLPTTGLLAQVLVAKSWTTCRCAARGRRHDAAPSAERV